MADMIDKRIFAVDPQLAVGLALGDIFGRKLDEFSAKRLAEIDRDFQASERKWRASRPQTSPAQRGAAVPDAPQVGSK